MKTQNYLLTFKEFCEKTKNVELVKCGCPERNPENLIIIENNKEIKQQYDVDGLYFPNDIELTYMWKYMATDPELNMNWENAEVKRKNLPLQFRDSLLDKLNLQEHFIDSFAELLSFLKSEVKPYSPNIEQINIEKLVSIVGHTYERVGLLHEDIRLQALESSPRIKKIFGFQKSKGMIGYTGVIYI